MNKRQRMTVLCAKCGSSCQVVLLTNEDGWRVTVNSHDCQETDK